MVGSSLTKEGSAESLWTGKAVRRRWERGGDRLCAVALNPLRPLLSCQRLNGLNADTPRRTKNAAPAPLAKTRTQPPGPQATGLDTMRA
eukprot:363237-Chlamydomonas_euryale.AAC.6